MEQLLSLSVSNIRQLTKAEATELFKKLNWEIPEHADHEFLRSQLRLKRLQLAENNTYENFLPIQLNAALNNRYSEAEIEDDFTDEENSYEELDFTPVKEGNIMAQHNNETFCHRV